MKDDPLTRDFLWSEYVENGRSIRQISRQTFSCRSAISSRLKRLGIPLRSEDEAQKLNKGQLGYGQKKVNDKIIEHKREQENLARMLELRKQGFSYHKIADVFNTMGIKTKNGGKRWHATTIMKILKTKEHRTENAPVD